MKEYKNKTYKGYHDRILVSDDFIKRNNFTLSRSNEEIKDKILELRKEMFDFGVEVLCDYLDFSYAKKTGILNDEYLKDIEDGKEKWFQITDIKEAVQDMLDYLVFGYMKALDERGLSASRTISKMRAWFWILGRDDLLAIADNEELYNPYGMPILLEVTKLMGLPLPDDCVEFSKHKC